MESTSLTLLHRLKAGDEAAWRRFDELYRPFLRRWLMQRGVSPADRDDLCQIVMLVALSHLPKFEHQGRQGSFRCWLRTLLSHECSRHGKRRQRERCVELGDALAREDSDLARQWDVEHDAWLLAQLTPRVKAGFSEQTWRAFELVKQQGKSREEAAQELGISVNAVSIACSRVTARFLTEGGEFFE